MPNWKAPGPDFVQVFRLKNVKSIQDGLKTNLQKCLENGNMPMWITKGWTTLTQKDKEKDNAASDYGLLLVCLWFEN